MIKRIAWGLLAMLLLLAAVLAFNTLRKGSRQIAVAPIAVLPVDEPAVAARLGEAVRLRTISSRTDAALNQDQFKQFHALLQDRFPKVHSTLKREVVGDLSLLYTWQGTEASAEPILLMAHQDVVPVAPGTEKDWTEEPFSGAVKGGFIWGRGAWDDKGNLMSQLEAIESLIASGYKPQRTVYLAFGADEEVRAERGAVLVVKLLKERKVRLHWIIDEGLPVTDGVLPGVAQPVAMIGTAEKGAASVVLKILGAPGHASMPPRSGTSAIGMLSAALKRIDDEQVPGGIRGVMADMFATLAPEMKGFSRVALSNLWLFGPVVQRQLESSATMNAMMRTTTALTIANAGNKDNVLPGGAEATVNFRLLPGDSAKFIVDRTRALVEGTSAAGHFEMFVLPGSAVEASSVVPVESAQFKFLARTAREVFPDALVSPGLYLAGSDSIFFADLSDHIFKFSPVRVKPEDVPRLHGTNERIATSNYVEAIRFYHRLVSEGAKAPSP